MHLPLLIFTRSTNLPHFKRKNYKNTYYIQDTEEVQEYISGTQDGIYYLTVLNSSVSPTVSPFTGEKFTQPIKYLYPQINRDNPVVDPKPAKSHALSRTIGETTINDVRDSLQGNIKQLLLIKVLVLQSQISQPLVVFQQSVMALAL